MSEKDTRIQNKQKDIKAERRKITRRSNEIAEDFVDRRRGIERRVIKDDISFEDRRKYQRRAEIVGVDFKDRRETDRRKKNDK